MPSATVSVSILELQSAHFASVSVEGTVSAVMPSQFSKTLLPISSRPSGSVISVMPEFLNALRPIFFTLSGRVISVIAAHWNALSPISVTVSGITTVRI